MTTLTAEQGTQPTLDDLTIGIINAASRGGVTKAALLLRLATGDEAVVVTAGVPLKVEGHGTLHVDDVVLVPEGKARVTLRLEA